jgi:hypothetical protein
VVLIVLVAPSAYYALGVTCSSHISLMKELCE